MNVQTVGAALKRKLGPLPVWAWAIIGGVALYFLRAQGYFGGGGVETGETLQPRQEEAREPQSQVTLEPGESVYDPNTGALTTAPGTSEDVDVPDDHTDTMLAAILKAVTKKPPKPRKAKHKKPPKKKPKPKPGHRQKPHKKHDHGTAGHKKHGDPKPRGHTMVKWRPLHPQKGGHHKAKLKPLGSRQPTATTAQRTRQRPTTPLVVRSSDRQHPVSSHSRRNKKPVASPPRPSSPAKRAHRAGHGKPKRKHH